MLTKLKIQRINFRDHFENAAVNHLFTSVMHVINYPPPFAGEEVEEDLF